MENMQIVQLLESFHELHKVVPNGVLRESCVLFEMVRDFSAEVAVVGKLHHDASAFDQSVPERLAGLVYKCLLISDHVRVMNRGKNTDFVERILPLFER